MKVLSLFRRYRLGRRLLNGALVGLLTLTGFLTIAVQPSQAQVPFNSKEAHGQTKQELTGRAKGEPLSAEERIDRAYDISESAGMREEKRQAEGKFDPKEDNESLVEKTKDAITGKKNNFNLYLDRETRK
jgi:hypothetical protein